MAALLAMCSALINKSLRGGLVVVGGINLGGSIDPLHNAIDVVELAVEKGASVVLMPVSSRKQLFDLSDDMATKVNVAVLQRRPRGVDQGDLGLNQCRLVLGFSDSIELQVCGF